MASRSSSRHDIVTIGASMGGVEALSTVVASLPPDLAAAVFIVLHSAPEHGSQLADVLSARGPLRATLATHGERFQNGRIYVAPSDNHLQLRDRFLHVARGPRENGHRPAVDALFRSAAVAYGPRVLGVVLTGFGDCGTAGALSIKARGGLVLAQDPVHAAAPAMPRSAIANVEIDEVVPLAQIGAAIARCVASAPSSSAAPGRDVLELEGAVAGAAAGVVCPICNGAMKQATVGRFEEFRCHVGHAFSLDSLEREQAESVERALWAAVRALEESAALAGRVARGVSGRVRARALDRSQTLSDEADLIREILLRGHIETARAPEAEAARRGGAAEPARVKAVGSASGQKTSRR